MLGVSIQLVHEEVRTGRTAGARFVSRIIIPRWVVA